MTMTSAASTAPSPALQEAITQYDQGAARGYLGAASIGLPIAQSATGEIADIDAIRAAAAAVG